MPTSFRCVPLLLAFTLAASSGCSDDRARMMEHLERGRAHLEARAYPEASLEFRSAVAIDPDSPEAHFGLAKVLVAQENWARAYWELQETRRLDPSNIEALEQLGLLLVHGTQEQVGEALEFAEHTIESKPGSVEAWIVRANALEILGHQSEADVAWQTLTELRPEDPAFPLAYAAILERRGDLEGVERVLERTRKLNPDSAATFHLAQLLAFRPGRRQEAEPLFREVLEKHRDPEVRAKTALFLSSFLQFDKRLDEALETLREAAEESPQDMRILQRRIRTLDAADRDEEAEALLKQAVETTEGGGALMLLAERRFRKGLRDEALEAAAAAEARAPEHAIRLRRARMLAEVGLERGDGNLIAEGKSVVAAMLVRDPDDPEALVAAGSISLTEGDFEAARTSLARAAELLPMRADVYHRLGLAQLATGDADAARHSLLSTLKIHPNHRGTLRALAEALGALGENEAAVLVGMRALQQRPADAELRMRVAGTLARLGRYADVLEVMEPVPEARRTPQIMAAIGRAHFQQGNLEAARAALVAAWKRARTNAGILRSLIVLDVSEHGGISPNSIARLRFALVKAPENPRLQRLQADISYRAGRVEEARLSLERAVQNVPNDLSAWEALAGFYRLRQDRLALVRTYERAVAANPAQARLHLMLALLHEAGGEPRRALERYDAALRVDPEFAVAKNNLANLLAERGEDLNRALALAQDAREALPDSPITADTLGWVMVRKDLASAGLPFLREAESELDPEDPTLGSVRYHLAEAYTALGEFVRARAVLGLALARLERDASAFDWDDPPWAAAARALQERLIAGETAEARPSS